MEEGRYRAFVSYSHRNARWGRRIHRALETYRIPKKLIGGATARGMVPPRLSPIFRDREELSAGDDLSQQVRDALADSEALVVLCSPHARASMWVAKEIETFRALHPYRPILAALIEGEPDEAFPSALFDGREPVAADFRKGKDGKRLATLKLVAGLTGLGLDALVQRDAQRQFRRVIAITLGAGIAVLVMAALLVMALRAQAEAERQRAEAEGLVEYMLTDLRDRLKGVGRLDVMTAVNERAMGYYGKQGDLSGLPENSLNRRARILHAMGEDDEKRGDLGKALAKFTEAHRTTAAVLAQKPNDADAIFAHAQSEYWVGYGRYLRNETAQAKSHWQQYGQHARALTKIAPKDVRSHQELGYAEGNLCSAAQEVPHDPPEALRACQVALDSMQRVLEGKPTDLSARLDVANRHAWLADAFKLSGNLEAALEHRMAQEDLARKLVREHPSDARVSDLWVRTEMEAARIFALKADTPACQSRRASAEVTRRKLAQLDPNNIEWIRMQKKINQLCTEKERENRASQIAPT